MPAHRKRVRRVLNGTLPLIVSSSAIAPVKQAKAAEKRLAGKTTTVPCGNCGGSGQVTLPSHLGQTLDALRSSGPSTSSQLAQYFRDSRKEHIRLTALLNRLSALIELGLVRREPFNGSAKTFLYEVVTNG